MEDKDKLSWRKNPKVRLNTICPYFTMFPLDYPYHKLSINNANSENIRVLDPFSGRGTTMFASRMKGVTSFGIDNNPVAVAISKSKLSQGDPKDIIKELKDILNSDISFNVPKGDFWEIVFHPNTLNNICKVRQALLNKCDTDERIALRAIILGSLHGPKSKNINNASYLSNQMPRTYCSKPNYTVNYLTKNEYFPPPDISIVQVVEKMAERYYGKTPPLSEGSFVIRGDSRKKEVYKNIKNVTHIITSPPYYGSNTYITDQWLRYWFLGGPESPKYELNGQLNHNSPDNFAKDLAKVWDNCAQVSIGGAILSIRFGGIPSKNTKPMEILKKSFEKCKSSWTFKSVKSAGSAEDGYRQSKQMNGEIKKAKEEFDVEMILK